MIASRINNAAAIARDESSLLLCACAAGWLGASPEGEMRRERGSVAYFGESMMTFMATIAVDVGKRETLCWLWV